MQFPVYGNAQILNVQLKFEGFLAFSEQPHKKRFVMFAGDVHQGRNVQGGDDAADKDVEKNGIYIRDR